MVPCASLYSGRVMIASCYNQKVTIRKNTRGTEFVHSTTTVDSTANMSLQHVVHEVMQQLGEKVILVTVVKLNDRYAGGFTTRYVVPADAYDEFHREKRKWFDREKWLNENTIVPPVTILHSAPNKMKHPLWPQTTRKSTKKPKRKKFGACSPPQG